MSTNNKTVRPLSGHTKLIRRSPALTFQEIIDLSGYPEILRLPHAIFTRRNEVSRERYGFTVSSWVIAIEIR